MANKKVLNLDLDSDFICGIIRCVKRIVYPPLVIRDGRLLRGVQSRIRSQTSFGELIKLAVLIREFHSHCYERKFKLKYITLRLVC